MGVFVVGFVGFCLGFLFSVKIQHYKRKKTEFNCKLLVTKPPDAFVRTLAESY